MASLNEALSDGQFINPEVKTLKEVYDEKQLFQMSSEELKQAEVRSYFIRMQLYSMPNKLLQGMKIHVA